MPKLVAAMLLAALLLVAEDLPIIEIEVEGLRRTSKQLVIDQLASRVGEPYSEKLRKLDVLYLDRLGIFSSIDIRTERKDAGVRLIVHVRETLPISFYVSATTTQDNGLSIGPALGAINLGGRAISAGGAVEFGGATNLFLNVSTPRLTRRHWWYEASYANVTRDNPVFDFIERSQEGEALVGYQFRPSLSLAGRFQFISLRSDQPGIALNPSGRDQVPTLALDLRYDTRDRWTNPRRGWYLGGSVARSGLFGGDGGWWTTQFDARRYQPIRGRHGMAAFSLLAFQSGQPGKDLPQWMVYGIGGANSVRGWGLGARKGKHQWLNTVEYRYQLVKVRPMKFFGYSVYWGLDLAVYGDLGTAWSEPADFHRNFIGGVGYGVRLLVPWIGMVRFDRAYGSGLRPAWGIGERADVWGSRVR